MKSNIWQPQYYSEDVIELSKKKLLDSFLSVTEYKFKIKTFNCSHYELTRQVVHRPKAACVLLYKIDTDEVVLIEQFRAGAINETSPWLLELIAGMVEVNETAESTAYRETKEESNCEIIKLIHIHDYLSSPGVSDEKTIVYCGLINSCDTTKTYGNVHECEDIKLHLIPIQKSFDLVKSGKILNIAAIIALQWLEINYKTIREKYF